MIKASKKDVQLHNECLKLLSKKKLKQTEKDFIVANYNEGISRVISTKGIFFTPRDLALDFILEVTGNKVLDLCAGIGMLSYHNYHHGHHPRVTNRPIEITCVELNPDFVEIGEKLLPEANWICEDITKPGFIERLGHYDMAISNPPFGSINHVGKTLFNYTGNQFEYKAIELASRVARYGAFIIPQGSAPFVYSGQRQFAEQHCPKYDQFVNQTKIELELGCSIDMSVHQGLWKFTQVATEIVLSNFSQSCRPGFQTSLF
jgi:predicted RNA methylase